MDDWGKMENGRMSKYMDARIETKKCIYKDKMNMEN